MEPIPEEVVERHIGAERKYCINTDCGSHVTEDRYGCGKWGLTGAKHPCSDFVPYKRAFRETQELPIVESVGYIPDAIGKKVDRVEIIGRTAKSATWLDDGIEKIPRYNVTVKVKDDTGAIHVTNEGTIVYDLKEAKDKLLDGLMASVTKREDKLRVVALLFPDAVKELT